MSLRATGEGHVSSIVFRRGVVDADGRVSVDPPGQYSRPLAAVVPDDFEKDSLFVNCRRSARGRTFPGATMTLLGGWFTCSQLSNAIDEVRAEAVISGKAEE